MTDESQPPPSQPAPRRSALLLAAGLYFGMVFTVGLILGPMRVLWLEPWIGATLAVLCEAPLLILTMWLAARVAPAWAGLQGGWSAHLAVGLIALALQQVADLAVGFGLRAMTLADQLSYFTTPAGMIYAVTLGIFALMPVARRFARGAEK